ncbi:hypothetical protein HYALB_00002107 [Hymenoscyphus albidus]|uniref:J domain-containing protein n=1 Tax=Hymenoscyphus albidus TaxID=595503 RepID=A0A9N9LK09_9HELO|nr:hypothetical protein HYALB_00002107 [Hymenoscyphus albidus]
MEDFYSILGVSQFSTISEIRDSYRRLALRFHPDKNKDENATSTFQQILRAWETLQDSERRAEYDREYMRVAKREREYSDGFEQGRWARENDFRAATGRWGENGNSPGGSSTSQQHRSFQVSYRHEKASVWKAKVQNKYSLRLQSWKAFRERWIPLALECQHSVSVQERQLDNLNKMTQFEVLQQFREAIELSQKAGKYLEDTARTLSSLLAARTTYIDKLAQALSQSQERYENILLRLECNQQRYEEEENCNREIQIREALEILGPRDLDTPLLIDLDRRAQAINRWTSLSRINYSVKYYPSLEIEEGPWHCSGEWERVLVEYDHRCSRCDKIDFHFIPECGPAKCPGCPIVVCNECHRALWLLRQYGDWVMSSSHVSVNYFFSLYV